MFKTTRSNIAVSKVLKANNEIDNEGIKIDKFNVKNSNNLTKFKKSKLTKIKISDFIKTSFFKTNFCIFNAKLAFTKFRQAFIKALIFYSFNFKHHI